MNENTSKLIEQLAQKLGTTGEYLWGVLLTQAPIAATISLCQCLAVAIYGYALWKINKRLIRKGVYDAFYEKGAEITILMVVAFAVFLVLLGASILSIGDIINGHFNPEYWALKKLLNINK